MNGFHEVRKRYNAYDIVCHQKLGEIINACEDNECNLKHIFEVGIGKKYFSIKNVPK